MGDLPTDNQNIQTPNNSQNNLNPKLTPSVPSFGKEMDRAFSETTPIQMVEVGRFPENPGEKEGEIPIERASGGENTVLKEPVYDNKGNVLMASPTHNVSVLPVKKSTFLNKEHWHAPVSSAIRWFLILMDKIVKKNKGEVVFQNE